MLPEKADTCIIKFNGDSIEFKLKEPFSTVTHVFGHDGHRSEKLCNLREVQSYWNDARKLGYEINGTYDSFKVSGGITKGRLL
jgi:hypothetical protein